MKVTLVTLHTTFLHFAITNYHGLKQKKKVSLTVYEARNLKSKCQHGWFLLEALKEDLFHSSPGFRELPEFLSIAASLCALCLSPQWFSLCLWICRSFSFVLQTQQLLGDCILQSVPFITKCHLKVSMVSFVNQVMFYENRFGNAWVCKLALLL